MIDSHHTIAGRKVAGAQEGQAFRSPRLLILNVAYYYACGQKACAASILTFLNTR